jgi:hypothetical protein
MRGLRARHRWICSRTDPGDRRGPGTDGAGLSGRQAQQHARGSRCPGPRHVPPTRGPEDGAGYPSAEPPRRRDDHLPPEHRRTARDVDRASAVRPRDDHVPGRAKRQPT